MYPNHDVHGNPIQSSDGQDTFTHPTMGDVTQGSYGPQPINPPPTTWDNN